MARAHIGRLFALVKANVVAGARWVAMLSGRSHRSDAVAPPSCTRGREPTHGVVPNMMADLVIGSSPSSLASSSQAAFSAVSGKGSKG